MTAIDFDFPVAETTEVIGAPTLRLSVEPIGPETRLFGRFSTVDDLLTPQLINNQVTPFKVEGELGTVETVEVESPAFQRRFQPGETLRFTLATTDAGFQSSRVSAGAIIHHSEAHPSAVEMPVVSGGFADAGEEDGWEGGFLFD